MEHRTIPFPVRTLGMALIPALLLSALLLPAAAAIFTLAGLNFSLIPVVARLIWFLSSFMGGFLAARITGSRRLLWGLAAGLAYLLTLGLFSLIFTDGSTGSPAEVWFPLLCLLGGGIGGVLS